MVFKYQRREPFRMLKGPRENGPSVLFKLKGKNWNSVMASQIYILLRTNLFWPEKGFALVKPKQLLR